VEIDRRHFLIISGLIGLGIAAKPVLELLSPAGAAKELAATGGHTGKRLAMIVDLKELKESKHVIESCIEACHRVHNVPDIENIQQELKWIWTVDHDGAFPEQGHEFIEEYLEHLPIPILCNHCSNPPCVRVCPTRSTWKRETDGVVMMDYHRCIGCRFCMAACPYGARSFNWRDPRPFIEEITTDFPTRSKGVVEKCNFCAERLVKGLDPKCVETCQDQNSKALLFGDLNDTVSEAGKELRKLLASRYSIRRKTELGTEPNIYYLV